MHVNTHSKQLLFTTVKITAQMAGGPSHGTGFILNVPKDNSKKVPVIITNKHVIDGATNLSIRLIGRKPNEDQPQLGMAYDFRVDHSVGLVGHPDPAVDVVAIPLVPIIGDMASQLFYRTVSRNFLPTPDEAESHDALEEVTFVGYPNGWSDEAHHTPIIRRGITATPMGLNYGGNPVFLVDGSVFGGSSGSPVFLFNEGSYPDGHGGLIVGNRLQLVGIMAATMVRHSQLPLAVSTQPHVVLSQEMNLGVAFNWQAIAETVEALEKAYGLEDDSQSLVAEPE